MTYKHMMRGGTLSTADGDTHTALDNVESTLS